MAECAEISPAALSVRAWEDFHFLFCQGLWVSPVPTSCSARVGLGSGFVLAVRTELPSSFLSFSEALGFGWLNITPPRRVHVSTAVEGLKLGPRPWGCSPAPSLPPRHLRNESPLTGLFSCPVHAGWASFPPGAWESGGGRGRWKGSPTATFSLSLPSILCQYLWSASPVTYRRLSVRHCLAAYHLSVYLFLIFCGKKLPGGHLGEDLLLRPLLVRQGGLRASPSQVAYMLGYDFNNTSDKRSLSGDGGAGSHHTRACHPCPPR